MYVFQRRERGRKATSINLLCEEKKKKKKKKKKKRREERDAVTHTNKHLLTGEYLSQSKPWSPGAAIEECERRQRMAWGWAD